MVKKIVFVTRSDFSPEMYELLKEKFEVICWNSKNVISKSQLMENIIGKFGLICYPPDNIIDKEVIQAAGDDLKVVSTFSVGYEHLDMKELKARGIRVGHAPNVATEAVAEHAVALLLILGRRIMEAHSCIIRGEWKVNAWYPAWLSGYSLSSSNVSIVGCGRIGLSILRKIKSFNPSRVFYYSRDAKKEADFLGAELKPLDYIMKESNFVIISMSLTDETKGIITKEKINSMKSDAILINVGRGGLVDESALIEALRNKKIVGAGLDVFADEPLSLDNPLLKLDNVVLTPHIASATNEALLATSRLAAMNVLAVLNNEKMPAEL